MCIRLFFQTHQDEIDELPDVLVDRVTLLPEILLQSRAESTRKSYTNAFNRWRKWAISNGIGSGDILPARALPVAVYLTSLMQFAKTPKPIVNAFYSIKWFHDINDLHSPTDSKLVINVLESAKRILSKPINKKEPVTVDLLQSVHHDLYAEGNILSQRTICALLLAFAGFLRSSELLSIRRSDILIHSSHMEVFIESSKTDRYRDGAWIVIARTGTLLCPVVNLEKYFVWANLTMESSSYVFCALSSTKHGYKLKNGNKHISYSTMRDLFQKAIAPHVTDITKYCLHSLRSGGATAAANKGVQDRLFKRHGRWVSEQAKDGYVKDNLEERLLVSRCLGL
jgi:integrase